MMSYLLAKRGLVEVIRAPEYYTPNNLKTCKNLQGPAAYVEMLALIAWLSKVIKRGKVCIQYCTFSLLQAWTRKNRCKKYSNNFLQNVNRSAGLNLFHQIIFSGELSPSKRPRTQRTRYSSVARRNTLSLTTQIALFIDLNRHLYPQWGFLMQTCDIIL